MDNELSRGEAAEKYFREGYNCSQAVVLSFSDILGVDKDSLLRIASSFGGGMGRLREVCGAFSGAMIVLGLLSGYDTPETGKVKAGHYANIQEFAKLFEENNGGSIVCRELLHLKKGSESPVPAERTEAFYKTRPCPVIIRNTADLMDAFLKEKKII